MSSVTASASLMLREDFRDEDNGRANRMLILKSALYASGLDLTYINDSVPRLPIACTRYVSYVSRATVAARFGEYHAGPGEQHRKMVPSRPM